MTVQGKQNAAEQLAEAVEKDLHEAQRLLDTLLKLQEPRTVENTLTLYDEILRSVGSAGNRPGLYERVHPDAKVREVAEQKTQDVDKFATDLSLHQGVYEALSTIDSKQSDKTTQHYLNKVLREYKRDGVDRDEDTRNKLRVLQEELTLIGQEFARNIQSDTRRIDVSTADLEGLPEDYIQAHPIDADGHIWISTDYPDYVPFMSYSKSREARRRLFVAFRTRAYPSNVDVLQQMITKRHESATLLGFESWAAFITGNKMVGSDTAAEAFIQEIATISKARAEIDYEKLLEYKRKDDPQATRVEDWEKSFIEEQVKTAEYDFDSQSVRPYFPYARVQAGILRITSELFGVEFREVSDAEVWSGDVETFDVYEESVKIGRFHLDMHPREDKYKHAAQFTLQNGCHGKQLPVGVLVCNFPRPVDGDPGLMEHRDVETFFHEFGHLLHMIFAGNQKWIGIGGISTEWDFVEAPSQMLEEWAIDTLVLQSFALHHETDQPIPSDLVRRLKSSGEFGRGSFVRQQMFYAMLSLRLYNQDPAGLDLTQLVIDLQNQYSPFEHVEGTYFHLSFGHLDGYSAIYYTYMWSLVIAKDLFSRFSKENMLDSSVPAEYRKTVLAAGGSAPAAELVEEFLGREYNFEAYRSWLNDGQLT